LTVTKHITAKLSIQTFQPNKLFTCFGNCHLFSLSSRLGNNWLQSFPSNSQYNHQQ
jgi:hypothetical protein